MALTMETVGEALLLASKAGADVVKVGAACDASLRGSARWLFLIVSADLK